jgi:hypothetical protein
MKLDPVTLDAVRHWLQLVRLAMFAGFVALGFVVLLTHEPARRRRAINFFLVYTLLAHLAILLPQNDAWPFTMYPMMATDATPRSILHSGVFFTLVDETGREWRVDALAWSPLFPQAIMGWFEVSWPNAGGAERRDVLRFLLTRAERARRHRQNGDHFFGNRRILGPLAAPDTNLWGAATQPATPFRALRVYRVTWIPTALAHEGRIASRTLMDEYRE